MRTHSGERPYPCDAPGCEYRASAASNLKVHMRTHSGERPYPCDAPGCEYRAAEAGTLKGHKRTHAESSATIVTAVMNRPF
jgi:insecticidal toxin complex protein TccC